MSEDKEKELAKEKIAKIMERHKQTLVEGKRGLFTEGDVGSKFILPLLEALGWDTRNIDEVREQRRTLTGPADYTLNINKTPKIVVEIKRLDEDLDAKRNVKGRIESYTEQTARYALHFRCDWFVLTNFEETRFYFTYARPENGLVFKMKPEHYLIPENFEKLWVISKTSVSAGRLARLEKKREREDIDELVLEDLLLARELLVRSVSGNDPSLQPSAIREAVQKILDRIIVIRTAEDRDIIGADSLWDELETWRRRGLQTPFMHRLKNTFREFEHIYNSSLFEPHFCDDLVIDNAVLEQVISLTYKYNFDLISADVLGSIYEDYIGHVLDQKKKGLDLVESFETRKKEGIYFTPTSIVEYVLHKALIPYIRGKALSELERIRVLDSACGSGSFLIKAFDYLVEEFKAHNRNLVSKKEDRLSSYSNLATEIEHKIIHNILHGVDLDAQATEIASVNLMLKALRKGEKLPLILDETVKCGNSLIWGTSEELREIFGEEYDDLNPFNWEEEFPHIMSDGGFDVVVGNPPHGAELSKAERKYFEKNYVVGKGYKNTASLFIEQCVRHTKENGLIGLVIPKSLTFSERWAPTRNFITQELELLEIADLSKAFKGVLLEQIIIVLRKRKTRPLSFLGTNLVEGNIGSQNNIPMNLCDEIDAFPIHTDKNALAIYYKLRRESKGKTFDDYTTTSRGLPLQSSATTKKETNVEPFLRGDDIHPYCLSKATTFVKKSELDEDNEKIAGLCRPKIVSQRIVAHILKPVDHIAIISSYDAKGQLNFDTVENTIITDKKYDPLYVLAQLNSKLSAWFAYTFVFNKAVRTMDLDDYYVSKLPFYPAEPEEQREIVEGVGELLELMPKFAQLDTDFRNYVNNYPQKDPIRLASYYNSLPHNNKRSLIPPNITGTLTSLRSTMQDDWVIVSGDYALEGGEEFNNADLLRMKFESSDLGQFIVHAINHMPKGTFKGNLFDKVLQLRLPAFNKTPSQNKLIIQQIIGEYSQSLSEYAKLAERIASLEAGINKRIYGFYNLTPDEIRIIEEPFSNESVILSLFPKPHTIEI